MTPSSGTPGWLLAAFRPPFRRSMPYCGAQDWRSDQRIRDELALGRDPSDEAKRALLAGFSMEELEQEWQRVLAERSTPLFDMGRPPRVRAVPTPAQRRIRNRLQTQVVTNVQGLSRCCSSNSNISGIVYIYGFSRVAIWGSQSTSGIGFIGIQGVRHTNQLLSRDHFWVTVHCNSYIAYAMEVAGCNGAATVPQ